MVSKQLTWHSSRALPSYLSLILDIRHLVCEKGILALESCCSLALTFVLLHVLFKPSGGCDLFFVLNFPSCNLLGNNVICRFLVSLENTQLAQQLGALKSQVLMI